MQFDNEKLFWKDKLDDFSIEDGKIEMITKPHTDLWQRTYYGFCNDNAPALMIPCDDHYFSFTVKTSFEGKHRFDQCGVIIYQNSNCWFKASVEYSDGSCQWLGSVVTNYGYSDWASTDIDASIKTMYYRLSRRESDFCIENSIDGIHFKQMRIFHLFEGNEVIHMGIYAASPEDSSFHAVFTEMEMTECKWNAHI